MFKRSHKCGCQSTAQQAMEAEMRRVPGSNHQFRVKLHAIPMPQAVRTEGLQPYAVLTGTVATNARQFPAPGDIALPPQRREESNIPYNPGGIRGSALVSARQGITLMMATCFRRAVQFVQPASPNTAPVLTYASLQINDLLRPEERALEMPRYHFAVVDSQGMLREAKASAQRQLLGGQAAGGP